MFVAARRSPILVPLMLAVEALAVAKGCLLAWEVGFPNIVVESNSNEVISSLLGSIHLGDWEAFPTLARVVQLGESFKACH